jgi:hypothetical protein
MEEVALRVIVELPNWEMHVVGTATVIGSFLAITAKHVVSAALNYCRTKTTTGGETVVESGELKLLQILPGPIYRFWAVSKAWSSSSDIAVLHLRADRMSEPNQEISWRSLAVRALPPSSGEKVIAFGFRESQIHISKKSDGSVHIDLRDKPTTSAGTVGQVFSDRRDSSMLNFPCFEVHAQFAGGMSGGVVLDEVGQLCGLVCAGTDFVDPNAPPLSYAVTLWPFLTIVISADRGNSYPRGVQYPIIDLALDKIIIVSQLENLNPQYFSGRTLPGRSE